MHEKWQKRVNLRNFWKSKVIYYKAIVLLFSKWCLCLVFVILELRKIQYFLARIHFSHGSFVMYSNALNLGLISNSPKNETLFDRKLKSYFRKFRNLGLGTDFLSIFLSELSLNFSRFSFIWTFLFFIASACWKFSRIWWDDYAASLKEDSVWRHRNILCLNERNWMNETTLVLPTYF